MAKDGGVFSPRNVKIASHTELCKAAALESNMKTLKTPMQYDFFNTL